MFDRFSVGIFFFSINDVVSSMKCNKFHKTFTSVDFALPSESEVKSTECDQCFGYVCYNKMEDEYVLGNGCRNEFYEACGVKRSYREVLAGSTNLTDCIVGHDIIGEHCTQADCNGNKELVHCVAKAQKHSPFAQKRFGPNKHITDVTVN